MFTPFIISLCFTFTCQQATQSAREDAAIALLNADKAWAVTTTAEDFMSFLTEDALYLYSPHFVKYGKEEWGPWLEETFERPGFELNWEAVRVEVGPSADMGYTSGDWRLTFKDAEGKQVEMTGSYLAVWERQDNGEWKAIAESEYSGKPVFELRKASAE